MNYGSQELNIEIEPTGNFKEIRRWADAFEAIIA
jgi:hypothetical protein